MKELSDDVIEREGSSERRPVELFDIYSGGNLWYYTSCDKTIVYDGKNYPPGPITRGDIEFNSDLKTMTCEITASRVDSLIAQTIMRGPIDPVYIMITRIFGDDEPYEGTTIFAGEVTGFSVQGLSVKATCSGKESLFRRKIPMFKVQSNCNHSVYSQPNGYYKVACNLSIDAWRVTGTIESISDDELTLTITQADQYPQDDPHDGYFDGGYVQLGTSIRMIMKHEGKLVHIHFPLWNLRIGDAVMMLPGCDGSIQTCHKKFNNLENFLGYPNVPINNPTVTELVKLI